MHLVRPCEWILKRFALNYGVALAYYSYFFFFLYVRNPSPAKRKFRPDSWPTASNMAHNLYYWSLAIVQWT